MCARDALGIRPFYYHLGDDVFCCASELQAVLVLDEVRARVGPNEGYLAEHLAARPTQREDTVFDGIRRLPAAHMLVVEPSAVRKRRYWEPAALDLRCRTDAEYAPVGAHLSGGLDSSSVVAVAASIREAGAVPVFETLSLEFPGRPYDERPYIDAMVAHTSVAAHVLRGDDLDPRLLLASLERSRDLPDAPTGEAMQRPILNTARARGMRVILTGVGGDEWLQGSEFYYADLIRSGRWGTLSRLLRDASDASPVDRTAAMVFDAGVRPLLPRTARRAARRLLGRSSRHGSNRRSRAGSVSRIDSARRTPRPGAAATRARTCAASSSRDGKR